MVVLSFTFVSGVFAQTKDDSGKLVGKAQFTEKCAKCHGLDRPLGKNKDASGWEKTVNRMKMKNPEWISKDNAKEIAHYLTAKSLFDTKCSKCHGTDRPLSKKKDKAGWEKTVNRMKMKNPEWISNDEKDMIIDYLVTEQSE